MNKTELNISKAEFKVLKQMYKNGSMALPDEIAEILLSKHYIEYNNFVPVNAVHNDTEEYILTNSGVIVYEQFYEDKVRFKKVEFRSWVAIVISVISVIISLLKR